MQGAESEQSPTRDHYCVEAGYLRRRPERQKKRTGETVAAQGDHWQGSHSGSSMGHNFGSSGTALAPSRAPPEEGTAFSCPAWAVGFSACVAPSARREVEVFGPRTDA